MLYDGVCAGNEFHIASKYGKEYENRNNALGKKPIPLQSIVPRKNTLWMCKVLECPRIRIVVLRALL